MKAKKHFGQNFLKNENIIKKIISANDISNNVVIEIGPGMGALTKHLVNAKVFFGFEIDLSLKPYLDEIILNHNNAKIIYEDILEIDLDEFLKKNNIKECILIANIPYYITGPILKLITDTPIIKEATLMMQKEVGDRIMSSGGKTYGSLSVLLGYKYDIFKITNVKNTSFYPVPKVDSVVLKFVKNNKYINLIKNEEKFIKFIKASFLQKRKTLVNNLVSSYKINKEKVIINLKEIENNFNVMERAENVSIERFITFSNGWKYD
ncbi:MAG: 16S rRNA (adenine(1518)-N(6)/adenine(1519)-N(6))-dimethyltransferase RsmA [Acholeplasmatales bacterium]